MPWDGWRGLSGVSFFRPGRESRVPHCLRRSSPLVFELRSKRWDSTDCPAHPALPRPAIAVADSNLSRVSPGLSAPGVKVTTAVNPPRAKNLTTDFTDATDFRLPPLSLSSLVTFFIFPPHRTESP